MRCRRVKAATSASVTHGVAYTRLPMSDQADPDQRDRQQIAGEEQRLEWDRGEAGDRRR